MGKKQRSPEMLRQDEMVKQAKLVPDKKFHRTKQSMRVRGSWPCRWSFFTGWRGFVIDMGQPKFKRHGEHTPESQFTLNFHTRPFGIVCFWHNKRLFWIGDWKWKREITVSS